MPDIDHDSDADLDRVKPSSTLHALAEHFHHDARDFADRFDALWEHSFLMHKNGRIKSFTDLLLACECTLKAHVVLSDVERSAADAYAVIRKGGHRIDRLANSATYLADRAPYDHLAKELGKLPVDIRYSLSASEMFFPMLVERQHAEWDYSATIGRHPWVMEIRATVETLLTSIQREFSGWYSDDIGAIFTQAAELRDILTRR